MYSGGDDDLCLSPFVWRSQLALKHKNLSFDIEKLTYRQINSTISTITNGQWKQVPVLEFPDKTVVYNSLPIAQALEARYEHNPLFPNGTQLSQFLEHYVNCHSAYSFFGLILETEFDTFKPEDQKEAKEKFDGYKRKLSKPKEELYSKAREFLKPIEELLKNHKFLEGDKPTYSDYIVFGLLQWLRVMTPVHYKACIEDTEDQTIRKWFESILELHGRYAKEFPVNTQYGEFALKV
ncbi:hypothetical protein K502DRAFT_294299 [Neoconidiobolus thromboides FSU 785]|nr:hypothetical protein K502DRAFT_294299 [Neoconidiobolus thromboides FSU 785]